jgi:hypothetical protein
MPPKRSFQKKPKGLSVPPKGSHGLLITCDFARTNQAVQQILKSCEQILGPLPTAAPEASEELSLEDEIAQLRAPGQKSRFIPYLSEVSGNFFVRFVDERDNPLTFAERYFQAVRESRRSPTTHVIRLYPILMSGFPNSEESLPVLKTLIEKVFVPDRPLDYEIVIHRRHKGDGQKESHDDLNHKIRELVGQPHQASYHEGKVAILWMSLGRNLYLSVVPQWKEWCGCNVPKFCAQLELKGSEEDVQKV